MADEIETPEQFAASHCQDDCCQTRRNDDGVLHLDSGCCAFLAKDVRARDLATRRKALREAATVCDEGVAAWRKLARETRGPGVAAAARASEAEYLRDYFRELADKEPTE